MSHETVLRTRAQLAATFPFTAEIVRGSLIHRFIRQQESGVEQWLRNYQKLKESLERICETNLGLRRAEKSQ